jgi:hypothetical protein
MSRSLWQLLIQISDGNSEIHLNCDECILLLEFDADLLVEGVQFSELQPAIRKHIRLCSECRKSLSDHVGKLEKILN